MKQAPGSDEDQVRVCAAMLPAAELQADPIGKLRTTGNPRVLIPTGEKESFSERGESIYLQGMDST